MRLTGLLYLILLSAFWIQAIDADQAPIPEITLAKVYRGDIDVKHYWISEKLDGVRAYWDGKHLISRRGNAFPAPEWFIKGFPAEPLDGELWLGRNNFERLVSIVRTQKPDHAGWKQIKYWVFDMPGMLGTFSQRLENLTILVKENNSVYIDVVKQYRLENHAQLMEKLAGISKAGGEGLMLRRANSMYNAGRSDDLLKLKPFEDAEARVVRHLQGKGKFLGMLGALLVESEDGRRFRIGTGFSDEQRRNPPPVGSLITFRFHGKTRNGIPRFASFMRIREPI